jgi:hypothetical protein
LAWPATGPIATLWSDGPAVGGQLGLGANVASLRDEDRRGQDAVSARDLERCPQPAPRIEAWGKAGHPNTRLVKLPR